MRKHLLKKLQLIPSAVIITAAILLSSCEQSSGGSTASYPYLSYTEINDYLDTVHAAYPSITTIETLGTSVDGKAIKALIISDNPADLEMEPRVRLTGCIHGNEKITTEVLVRFLEYILEEYSSGNTEISGLVESRYITIIPVLNPDGYENWTRYNSNGIDLNRNFSRAWSDASPVYGDAPFSEPESTAMSQYSILKHFTTGITLHSGAVIVNMPFDYGRESLGVYPAENLLVKYMGLVYSGAGTTPFYTNPDILVSSYVYNGTINGGDWYVITGSMQDWSYLDAGCLDYTVEISRRHAPSTDYEVETVFSYNRDSLIAFIKESGRGVYGRVTDGSTGLADVKITIPGGDIVVYTDSQGYYHRLLQPGTYSLTYELTGYTSQAADVEVPDDNTGASQNIILIHE